ncbi:MAG: nicotinamide-nucleotide adenylyltransferase [Candidatus Aenigmatarchaeota archaeon]
MKALFIGRFQPFHQGHLHAIKKAMKKFDLIIAIGSSDKFNTKSNPFSFEERKKMIEACLGSKVKIMDAEDKRSDEEWAEYLMKKVEFDVVISGSEWIKKCFEGKKEILNPDFLQPNKYNGTKIREKIAKGKEWGHLVPPKVRKIIKEINGEERIRELYKKG